MAQFPTRQADIVELAERVLKGLRDNKDVYPDPIIDLADFEAAIKSYHQALAKLTEAKAAMEKATRKKQQAFDVAKTTVKRQLRYAEYITDFDDEKLKLLGWSGRKERTPPAESPAGSKNNASSEADND